MKKLGKFLFLVCILSMLLSMASCSEMNMSPDGGGGGGYGSAGSSGDVAGGESSSDKSDSAGTEFDGDIGESPSDSSGEMTEDSGADEDIEVPGDSDEPDSDENVYLPSGMITAGAWNDNDNYQAWLDLFSQGDEEKGKFFDYTNPDYSWGFNSQKRVKVTVTCGENAVAGASVVAYDEEGNSLFSAVSDAAGNAYIFTNADSGEITVTSGEASATATFSNDIRDISVNLSFNEEKRNVIEIMLVVDVTGSMGDEIYFLKAELADVINRISANDSDTVIKLALLFYRDTDDKVPFDYYDFTDVTTDDGLAAQQAAINKQSATGGGDYPEAVDDALELAVNKQWSTGATTKIIFHVLDAPAHEGDKYASKLVNATKTAAEKGIRICPIICSGAAESTEYTMREAAIYTGGTFVFVTDDSGIGGSHHDPGLPNVTVELLNSLMVRLVNGYHTGNFADPVYWKEDPNLGTK